LEGVVLNKGFLKGMKPAVSCQTLNGQDFFFINIFNRKLARTYSFVVNEHGASSAKPRTATILGSRETEICAQYPKEHAIAIKDKVFRFSVELKMDCLSHSILLPNSQSEKIIGFLTILSNIFYTFVNQTISFIREH
jgi:hypothetical protein